MGSSQLWLHSMDGGSTVMMGIEKAVQLQEKKQSHEDWKRHLLSSRLREKLFEVEEDEIGEHPPSDKESDNDDEADYETNRLAKSSLKNHTTQVSMLSHQHISLQWFTRWMLLFRMDFDGDLVEQ